MLALIQQVDPSEKESNGASFASGHDGDGFQVGFNLACYAGPPKT
jgi:hypothetical protein